MGDKHQDSKPKGGRGNKAELPTVVVRVPECIREEVNSIAAYARINGGSYHTDLLDTIRRYKQDSKSTRDHTISNKLLDELTALIGDLL